MVLEENLTFVFMPVAFFAHSCFYSLYLG